MQYKRLTRPERPVLAICYDFDRTLSPEDMQAQGYIQDLELDVGEFWEKTNRFADEHDMDSNLAYMFMMAQESEGKILLTRKTLQSYGAKVRLYPGAEDWFDRIDRYGEMLGVQIEHYIISSGQKEMIEGTSIADKFTAIFASEFLYSDRGAAIWPAQAVNFTNKTQFLFRIEKGVMDVNDPGVNEYFTPDKLRVPFRNIVYIGDSFTDIPCMKLVNSYGGHSIGVYDPDAGNTDKVCQLIRENRIRYYAPADYREGGQLDRLLHAIINKTAAYEKLEKEHLSCTCK